MTPEQMKAAISNLKTQIDALTKEKREIEKMHAEATATHKIGDIVRENRQTPRTHVVVAIRSRGGRPEYFGKLLKKDGTLGSSEFELYWIRNSETIGHMDIPE
jgi:hypothetical protein